MDAMGNIRYIFIWILGFTFLRAIGQVRDLSVFLDTVRLRLYDTTMRAMTRIRVYPSDSIYVEEYKETRYFNTDTLFHYLAVKGYKAVEDEVYYYYYDIVAYMSHEQAAGEVKKLRRIARRYKNPEVTFESEFLPLYVELDRKSRDKFNAVMDDMYRLAKKKHPAEMSGTSFICCGLFSMSLILTDTMPVGSGLRGSRPTGWTN